MYGRCGLNLYSFPLFTLGDFCKDVLFIQAHFFVKLGCPLSIALPANELQRSEIIADCRLLAEQRSTQVRPERYERGAHRAICYNLVVVRF
jgi:hypothetical protein